MGEHMPERKMLTVNVQDVMSTNLVTLHEVETVGRILQLLDSCKHNGFPVLQLGTKELAGLVERAVLVSMLRCPQALDLFQEPTGPLQSPAPMVAYETMHFELD